MKSRSLFLLLVLAVTSSDRSVPQAAALQLQPNERDVTYCIAGDVELKMDIYYPTMATTRLPVAMYVHGGGWTGGDKRSGAGSRDISTLIERGYLVTSVNYRLAPRYKFPAMIEDVKCAVRFLRANALRYNLNPDKIGVWGSSAGGHLVALLGTTDETAKLEGAGGYLDQSSRVQAVVDMFGPTDLNEMAEGTNRGIQIFQPVFCPATGCTPEILDAASPTTYVSKDDPPFLFLHGEKDTLVPPSQSEILHEMLEEVKVPSQLVMVKNAGHGFTPSGGPISPTRDELTKMLADFFDKYLK
jgi:acetyl esterase/lipase